MALRSKVCNRWLSASSPNVRISAPSAVASGWMSASACAPSRANWSSSRPLIVLDTHLAQQSSFQLVANLKKDPAADAPRRTLSFDDCYVEGKSFGMDAGGSAVTTYAFSATRVREE
jgi:hypothetical protein